MTKDTFITDVIFRAYKDKQIIAIMPHEPCDNYGNITSYMHIGQHSAADYIGVIKTTKIVTESQYSDLKAELEDLGYNLRVIKKRNHDKYITKFNEIRK